MSYAQQPPWRVTKARRHTDRTGASATAAGVSGEPLVLKGSIQRWAALSIMTAMAGYLFTWPLSHNLGANGFAGVVGVAWLYCIIWRRWSPGLPYAVLIGVYLSYAVMSMLDWLPLAWTDARYPEIIPQQLSSYLALPAFATVASDVFKWLQARHLLKKVLFWSLLICWIGFGWCPGTELGWAKAYLRVTDLTNAMYLRWIILVFLLAEMPLKLWRFVVLVVVMFAFADDSQTQLTAILAVILCIVPFKRTAAVCVMGAMAVAVAIAPHFWQPIWEHDRNDGIRAVFWRDAMDAVVSSHFLGIGFGTQSVHYVFADFAAFALKGDRALVRLIGLHNSFYQSLFRCGIFGFGALTWWFIWLIRRIKNNKYLTVQVWLVLSLFTSLNVNPSLESVNFIVGDALALGLFLSLSGEPASRLRPKPLLNWSYIRTRVAYR